ncbi:eukaryotic translation initiation factor 4E transporter-like isoform X3 [Photinus pyralis]|nr:eukaryotic translation initiation factor 4E transporter-like isoform X3 [Photinus pyralis]XP_031330185.1 eukaryotic translation initiation factor 4E transporter-like isoform X3 [Photinus pyralis]XP_031330186.1 eukaryotic translation initiation factor 4E transporter-like isoform X3 [Photinus pyralis]
MSVSTTTTTPSAAAATTFADDETQKIDQVPAKDRDEQMDGLSLSLNVDATELNDPAILAVKPGQPVYRYTREELMQLRQVPLSQKRPEHLCNTFNNPNGFWDPELWHRNTVDTLLGPEPLDIHKRRPGDPRERIRKEQDGIVLSPQRRSFNSGCFVPLKENQRPNRQHSPIGGKPDTQHIGHREIPQGARRIGSGRILSRDIPWDFQEKQAVDNEFGYRRDDRFERRPFGRDYDAGKDKDKHRNNRFNERRRMPSENRDDEPEWFTGGPVSQADTIELRGFDDSDCERLGKKKLSNAQKKRLKERGNAKTSESQPDAKDGELKIKTNTPDVVPIGFGKRSPPALDKEREESKKEIGETANPFNFDDILKCDTIANLLPNGVSGNDGDASGSRFSQWFKMESPKQAPNNDSRRSSLQDDHIIRNLLNEINIMEPNVTIPGDSESYFAPISPAANTGVANLKLSSQKPVNLMEMLQKGKAESAHAKNLDANSKVMSLAELEARIIHQGAGDPGAARNSISKQSKSADEMNAFKRLLAQVSDGQAVTASNGPLPTKPQSMSLMELLSHSQQQDEAAGLSAASHLMGSSSPSIHNDVAFKMHLQNHVQAQIQQRQQAQMEMLNKLINANAHRQQLGTSPLHEMTLNQSRELLSRPEAQAILQGMQRGDITSQHLYQQLAANPAMQSRHRDLLLTILKYHGGGGGGSTGVGPSPRVLSPVPPHPMFPQQQQQQLRVSPLPTAYCVSPILATSPNTLTVPAMHQRIPSPRELQVHTQNIMQQALIKKKLEEQTENYKKRQEMQHRGQSPGRGLSPAKHISSPTPLAFTPTSVLRKMTADKDDASKDPSKSDIFAKMPPGRAVTGMKSSIQPPQQQQHPPQTWNIQQQLKQPVGRPIVKANANLQTSQQDQQYFHQQQRIYNHHQQQHQARKLGQQQFPSSINPSQQPGASSHQTLHHFSTPHSFSSNPQPFQQQLTQHQLRAQHQQHQPPQQNQYSSRSSSQTLWSQQQHPLLASSNYDGRISHMGDRGGANNNGGDLSPTSNQLARWFSPELLERARAGKVPNLPSTNTSQHAISLEELERQTAPPVHN